jgi:hypothetical protein
MLAPSLKPDCRIPQSERPGPIGEGIPLSHSQDQRGVNGEFQISPVSRSFYLDPILPLQKYERNQLGGAEVTTL